MDIHGSGLTIKIIAPDLGQQTVSGQHDSFILHQVTKQLKLFVCQCYRGSIHQHLMLFHIHRNQPYLIEFPHFLRGSRSPAKQRPHSGHQLHHAKWFRQIIIRSTVQSDHFIIFRSLRCQHHHRKLLGCCSSTQFSQNGKSILIRKHNI